MEPQVPPDEAVLRATEAEANTGVGPHRHGAEGGEGKGDERQRGAAILIEKGEKDAPTKLRIDSDLDLFGRQWHVHKAIPLVAMVRWSARILGSLWAVMVLVFVLGEGSPALGSQPASVQWAFAAKGLWLIGFVVGWRFEGMAALLILAGSIIFHAVEARFPLGWALEVPTWVGLLYAMCWVAAWRERKHPLSRIGRLAVIVAIMLGVPLAAVSAGVVYVLSRPTFDGAIQSSILNQLRIRGASVTSLQVAVRSKPEGGSTATVTYRGLRDFRSQDGSSVPANGKFQMEYVGGGKWEGKLGGTLLTAPVGVVDDINKPFVDDPAVVGDWTSVDFVVDPATFDPSRRQSQGALFFKEFHVWPNGRSAYPWLTWTKGYFLHHGDQTASRYEIREINGQAYLFYEWKSGDVMVLGAKPRYYVLKKVGVATVPAAASQPRAEEARLRLEAAETRLRRAEALFQAGQSSAIERLRAQFELDVVAAELKGDSAGVARLKARFAEKNFQLIDALYRNGQIDGEERLRALFDRDIAAAELKGDSAQADRLRRDFAHRYFDLVERKFRAGLVTSEEYNKAKLDRDLADVGSATRPGDK
jgi:hypothetical protein